MPRCSGCPTTSSFTRALSATWHPVAAWPCRRRITWKNRPTGWRGRWPPAAPGPPRLEMCATPHGTARTSTTPCFARTAATWMSGAPPTSTRWRAAMPRWLSGSRVRRCVPSSRRWTRSKRPASTQRICRPSPRPTPRWTMARCCCPSQGCSSWPAAEAARLRPSTRRMRLDEIPQIAVEVFEHGHGAVGLALGVLHKAHAARAVGLEVAQAVVGLQEQEHAPARLVAHARGLFLIRGAGQQQAHTAATGGYGDPALALGQGGVLDQHEAQRAHIKAQRLVIVAHGDAHLSYHLGHGILCSNGAVLGPRGREDNGALSMPCRPGP